MSDKEKFWMLLDRYPFAAECWNRAESSVDLDRVKARMWSRQERIVVHALVSIWFGSGDGWELDFTDLATLDMGLRVPLAKWIVDPCWP